VTSSSAHVSLEEVQIIHSEKIEVFVTIK